MCWFGIIHFIKKYLSTYYMCHNLYIMCLRQKSKLKVPIVFCYRRESMSTRVKPVRLFISIRFSLVFRRDRFQTFIIRCKQCSPKFVQQTELVRDPLPARGELGSRKSAINSPYAATSRRLTLSRHPATNFFTNSQRWKSSVSLCQVTCQRFRCGMSAIRNVQRTC